MITPYPLLWPVGYPRTDVPKSAQFKLSLAKARDELRGELYRMDKRNGAVITSNALLKKDGEIAGNQPRMVDAGVAVYFSYKGQQVVLACDKWSRISDNVRAICLTLQAMRGMDRWGVSDILARAFVGFTALPPPRLDAPADDWRTVLGVTPADDWPAIVAAYKQRVKETHPDADSGSDDAFLRVQGAFKQAQHHVLNK